MNLPSSAAAAPPGPEDVTPLTLPAPPPRPARPSVPWLASTVPVVGALIFWAVTGSSLSLLFAVLGPLIAAAGVVDGARTARRARRASEEEAREARDRVRARVAARHRAERDALRALHPDVAGFLARDDQVWRPVPERRGVVVVGRGTVASTCRVGVSAEASGDDLELARSARELSDAPVVMPVTTGVAVVGPDAIARATLRAIVLQLSLAHPPGELQIVAGRGSGGDEEWIAVLPHARLPAARRIVVLGSEEPAPEGAVAIATVAPGRPVPPHFDLVVRLDRIDGGLAEAGSRAHRVVTEAVDAAQASTVAGMLAARAPSVRAEDAGPGAPLRFGDLRRPERVRSRTGLPVVVGATDAEPFVVDIVRDGPHAVVTGMTGAGKSELLCTWVVALCAAYTTADVSFLLADFKGGTAFDALADLPHVIGVVTDLDPHAARRAIESLRAEVRFRESTLARAGARDLAEVDLPRLLVVVDEYAALRDAHPEADAVFGDIAARGRALGMHLVVGTQRTPGVVREALLANCPLRVSLRLTDRLDSRAVVGVDAAAELPGGEPGRGLAIIRRAADAEPSRVRIALVGRADVDAARDDAGGAPRPSWLPPLPTSLALSEVAEQLTGGTRGLVLGLGDEPDEQRQRPIVLAPRERGLLAVGGPRSGKSTLLDLVAAQVAPDRLLRVGPDPEAAWDALAAAATGLCSGGTVLLVDDLDALLARFPDDHARAAAEMLEMLARDGVRLGVRLFATAQRFAGATARVGELLPHRLLLPASSRAEHVAAGGDPSDHRPRTPPGRGVLDGTVVQVATAPRPPVVLPPPPALWTPPPGLSGFVGRRVPPGALTVWERSGVRTRPVGGDGASVSAGGGGGGVAGVGAHPSDERVVLVGDPDQWFAHPRMLQRVRADGGLVVDAGCEREFRLLTGDRSLPPYVDPRGSRAWLCRADAPPARVALDPSYGDPSWADAARSEARREPDAAP